MRLLKINYETVHFNYADRIGNLTAEAVGVVKGEKHFPVYSGNQIFKPLSKSKPFSTPLFAYAEVFWSNVINEYFVSAPLYQLAFCHGYEEETQKYYDYGTVVPRIYNEDEQLLNLLEFFRKYPDKKVDIDQYENYCMMFYDYADILEASYFQNYKDLAEQFAMQILVSVLKGDQNYHYENIAFVCNKKGEILRLAPMIDHEFSTYFMFPDNSAQHMYWYSELIRSMEGHEVQDYEYDCLKNPKERQMMEKSAVCLHKNLVYIKEHYPEVTGKFIEKLNCLEHDLEENPSPFYLQENIEYPGTANSYAYMSGKARYKDHDEEKAKLLEEKYHEEDELAQREKELNLEFEKQMWNQERISAESKEKQVILNNLEESLQELQEENEQSGSIQEELDAVRLAIMTMNQISEDIYKESAAHLNQKISDILSQITEGRYTSVFLDANMEVRINTPKKLLSLEQVSRGTMEQIYFALRMAVGEMFCQDETMPIILDDAFVMYDDKRLKQTLKWLYHSKRQVILFTCHGREQRILDEIKQEN